MLNQITISSFKNIEEIKIDLERINVFVGSNNSGKSSILQAVQFAVSVAQTTHFENSHWNRTTDKMPTSLTPEQLMYAPFRDVYSLAYGGRLQTNKGIEIGFLEDDGNACTVSIKKGKNKNISTVIEHRTLGERLRNITEPYTVYVPGLAGIPSFEEYKSPGIVRRAAARGDANNVFRNILYLLNSIPESWVSFTSDLRDIFPDIEIIINFDREQDEHIQVRLSSNGNSLPIDAAGTGVLQIMQILSYVNLYKPKILLLDEPDAHLHPNNQRKLAQKLNDLTQSNDFQVLISTHSRHFVYELEPFSKLHWVNSGKLIEEDQTILDVLIDIGALDKGDLLKNGQLKLIVLTEDEHQEFLKAIIAASRIPDDEVEIWSYKGCSDVKTANVLAAFIKKHAPNVVIAVHRDRDYFEDNKITQIEEEYNELIQYKFFTLGTDIESHFINPQHIQALYPEIGLEVAEQTIQQSYAACYDRSRTKFINVLTDQSMNARRGHEAGQNVGIAERKLADNIARYSIGKTVYGTMKGKLQVLLGRNPDLVRPTDFIRSPVFELIKHEIFEAPVAEEMI